VVSSNDDGLGMPLDAAMETQRAVRRLLPDPVDDALILRILELATKAPTSGNSQHWEFVVVRDADVKHQLARLNRQAWSVYRRLGARRARRDESTRKIVAAVQWQADHFEEIPVVIVACLHGRSPVLQPAVAASSFYGSAYPAVQNLLLAARAAGLGAALTTLPLWSIALARRTLGLPPRVTPVAVVPLGWPRGSYGPTTRRPVGEVVHLNRYGNRAFR
jgi:nitroreductase